MRRPAALLIPVAVALFSLPFTASCHPKPRVPGWVQAAPGDSLAAFSGEAGWMLTHKDVQSLISRDPLVERALDLFLQKAHINPRTETGRVTFHVIGVPQKGENQLKQGLEHVLIQLNQFKDPTALVSALAESFPQEGSLRLQGQEWPLYVILDIEAQGTKAHIRAASDDHGQVWIGSLEALNRMAARDSLADQADAALAAEWISARAPFRATSSPRPCWAGCARTWRAPSSRTSPGVSRRSSGASHPPPRRISPSALNWPWPARPRASTRSRPGSSVWSPPPTPCKPPPAAPPLSWCRRSGAWACAAPSHLNNSS